MSGPGDRVKMTAALKNEPINTTSMMALNPDYNNATQSS